MIRRCPKKEKVVRERVKELQPTATKLPVKVKFVNTIRGDPGISGTSYALQRYDGKRWNVIGHELNFTHSYVANNSVEEVKKGVAHEMAHVRHHKVKKHDAQFKRTCKKYGGGNRCGIYIE